MNFSINGKVFNEAELATYVKELEAKVRELEVKVESLIKDAEVKVKAAETGLAKWIHNKITSVEKIAAKDGKEVEAFAVKIWDGAESHVVTAVKDLVGSKKPAPVTPPVAPAPISPVPASPSATVTPAPASLGATTTSTLGL